MRLAPGLPGRRFWLAGAVSAMGVAALLLARPSAGGAAPGELYLRAFKEEGELEMWVRNGAEPFRLVKVFPILAHSGQPGPKRRGGDRQVPEGFYEVDRFNPQSRFHLSLRLNYPNAADRILSDPAAPGGDIYLHGGARSIGCLALGDSGIEEVYREAEQSAQPIRVHIFPARMQGEAWQRLSAAHPELADFWRELQPMYNALERDRSLPAFEVLPDGKYSVSAVAKPPAR